MTAGIADIVIEQGATFTLRVNLLDGSSNPVDLTGCTAVFRLAPGLFTADVLTYNSPPNVVLGGVLGTIDLLITAAITELLEITRGLWNVEVTFPDTSVVRVVQGAATLSRQPGAG